MVVCLSLLNRKEIFVSPCKFLVRELTETSLKHLVAVEFIQHVYRDIDIRLHETNVNIF